MKVRRVRVPALCLTGAVLLGLAGPWGGQAQAREETITLRVCNWEEYIDLGDWDEEERIELDNGVEIFGENALYDEFEDWYYETYGKRVQVEYSCFGTNEDLYNQLTLGDTYDLVCPSDYMIMKLMAEGALEPYSESFFDREDEENYYARCVSPYIADVFEENEINGESWSRYAAGYMWGVTGVLYNPELMTLEEASTWAVFDNPDFYRQITLKDNVRDTYFSTLGYLRQEQLMDEAFLADAEYQEKLGDMMNDVSPETIDEVEELLGRIMGNIYALETDSGKADMVTGKIAANYQWSGDAVYAMDQAEEDDVYLQFAVPRECTNLWFDGWVMLRAGIGEDMEKKQAAEAFVNFLSRPENAVRNMYYIGYTSAISGGEDDTVFSYLEWCYGAEEDEEDTVAYPVGYFFGGDNADEDYIVHTSQEQVGRQLYTQYPSQEVISRAAVMGYFDEEQTRDINQMWINIRCLDVREIPLWCVLLTLCIVAAVGAAAVLRKKNHYCG